MVESLPYEFTETERQEMLTQLVQANQALIDIRRDRKSTLAEIAARMSASEKLIVELTTKISQGFELREVEVLEIRRPGCDYKEIIRADNNASVRKVPLSWLERQEPLGFDGPPDDRPGPEQ